MNPIQLASLSAPVINLYSSIEQDMLTSVAEKLSTNKGLLDTDPLMWKLQKLEMKGMLDKENLKTIAKKAKLTASELNNVLLTAGLDGLETNEEILKNATKKGAHLKIPTPIAKSPQIIKIFKAYEQQAKNVLNLTNQSLILQSQKVYVDILNRASGDMLAGHLTGDQALRKAVRHWAEKGMPVLKDSAGRERGVEGYVRSVLMTTSNNVVNELQDVRLNEWGVTTVEISSHAGNRPGCVPYAGRIFSLLPDHPEYPYLYDTAIGRIGAADSLFGVNCGHIKYPWVQGVSKKRNFPNDPVENKKVYENSQRQRTIERSIRKAKTQERMFEAMGDKKGVVQAKALVSNRQKSMRKFIDESNRTRRYGREQIIVKGPSGISKVPVPKGEVAKKVMLPIPKVKPVVDIQKPIVKQIKPVVPKVIKPIPKPKNKTNKSPDLTTTIKPNKDFTQEQFDKLPAAHIAKLKKQYIINVIPSKKVFKPIPEPTKELDSHWYDKGDFDSEKNRKSTPAKGFEDYKYLSNEHPDIIRDKETLKNAMSLDDINIIKSYTGSTYTVMNNYLRTGAMPMLEVTADNTHRLKKILEYNSKALSENTILTRRIDYRATEHMWDKAVMDNVQKALSGDNTALNNVKKQVADTVFSDKAFVSSSFKDNVFMDTDQVELQIMAPKGFKNGLFIESVSGIKNEAEYLINAGQKFKVIDADMLMRGKGDMSNKTIVLKVVPID